MYTKVWFIIAIVVIVVGITIGALLGLRSGESTRTTDSSFSESSDTDYITERLEQGDAEAIQQLSEAYGTYKQENFEASQNATAF